MQWMMLGLNIRYKLLFFIRDLFLDMNVFGYACKGVALDFRGDPSFADGTLIVPFVSQFDTFSAKGVETVELNASGGKTQTNWTSDLIF